MIEKAPMPVTRFAFFANICCQGKDLDCYVKLIKSFLRGAKEDKHSMTDPSIRLANFS